MTFSIDRAPLNGTLGALSSVSDTAAKVVYAPAAGFSGNDSFDFEVDDGSGSTDKATVIVNVNGLPSANEQTVDTNEDTPVVITLTGSDPEGSDLRFSVVTAPTAGTLGAITALSGNSVEVSYTPNADVSGADTFQFQVDDSDGGVSSAEVTIDVAPVADPARALNDVVVTDEDNASTVFTVLDNDLDPDSGDTISFASTDTTGLVGGLADNGDGSYVFDPAGLYEDLAVGESRDTGFTYTIDSSDGSSATGIVTVTVEGVNDEPNAGGDQFGVPNLLVNGGFEAGDFSGWDAFTTSALGAYYIEDNTTSNFGHAVAGPSELQFHAVSDQDALSRQALMQTFTVPAEAVSLVTSFDMFVKSLAVTAVDPDGLVLTVPNQQARVDLLAETTADPYDTGPGVVRNLYTVESGLPAANVAEPYARYSFDLSDDVGPGQIYRLRFGVAVTTAPLQHGVDDVRIAAGTDERTVVNVAAPGLLGNDGDPDSNDVLAVASFDAVSTQGAAVVVNADGSYSYDPSGSATLQALERGDTVIDTFDYTVSDGNGGSQSTTVEVVVNGLTNEPPVADAQAVVVDEDDSLEIVLSGSDANGDPLTFSIDTLPALGSLGTVTPIDDTSARVVYTPNADETGADSFVFLVDDGEGETDTATVDITISSINDAPTALTIDNASVPENQPPGTLVGTLSTTDADHTVFTYSLVAGTGDSGNASFAIVGEALQTAASFDFETLDGYSVRIRTDDGDNGLLEQIFTITVIDANDPPVATGETFTGALGNTLLAVNVATGGPQVFIDGNLLSNDVDSDGPSALSISGADPVSGNGANVTVNADGTFTYLPAVGFTGTDTIDYTVFDGAAGAVATASVEVSDMVWYFDSTVAGGGDGRSTSPIEQLPGAAGIGGAGDILFVRSGTQTSGVTLKAGQQLLGEGVGLVVDANVIVGAGTRPVIANATGAAIVLGSSNTIRGLDINSQSGVTGTTVGELVLNNASITSSNGPALKIDGASSLSIALDQIQATNLTNDGEGISLSNSGGANVTVSATTILSTPNGQALRAANIGVLGSVLDFGDALLIGKSGLQITDNPGADLLFESLVVTTSGGPAVEIRDTGMLTIAGNANTVDAVAGGGIGFVIANTELGDPGDGSVTFERISVEGGSDGIVLSNTGNTAAFEITGDDGGTAESGGVITGATDDGIELDNVSGVSLNRMAIRDSQGSGIGGSEVVGFTLSSSVIENSETGLSFDNLTGTVSMNASIVRGSDDDNIAIRNSSGTANLTFINNGIRDNDSTTGNDGIVLEGSGAATISATLNGNDFAGNRGDDLQATASGNSALDIRLNGGTMTGDAFKLGGGIVLTGDADLDFNLDGVSIDGAFSSAIVVNLGSASLSDDVMSGTINDVQIGTAGVDNSGSRSGSGVRAIANGDGRLEVTISNNTIVQYNNNGIEIIGRDGSNRLNATISANALGEPGALASDGLHVQAGATGADTGTVCAAIGDGAAGANGLEGAGGPIDVDFRIRQRFSTTVILPGYTGGGNDDAAVVAFIQGNNIGTPSGSAAADAPAGFSGTGAGCP